MQRILIFILVFPGLLSAQPTLERRVIGTAGEQHSSGTTFSIGEAITVIGQNGGAQLTASFQQGTAVADSVWPGDANDDFVADNLDLLAIGLAYGASGPTRSSVSNAWQAQAAPTWLQGLPSGVNYQHPDCNGDGIINDDDTLAINANYGLVHQKNGENDSTGIPLTLSFPKDSALAGQTISMEIRLGTDSLPAEEVYGLAFRIELDTTLIQAGATMIQFEDSWLGNPQQDVLTLRQAFTVDDRIHLALTRKDQMSRNGHGTIASVIIMIDDLSGKNGISESLKPNIVDPVLITVTGNEIPVNIQSDSLTVTTQSTRIPDDLAQEIRLYPNPTSGRAELDLGSLTASCVRILDLQGRLILSFPEVSDMIRIDLSHLPDGSYQVEANTPKGIWRQTLLKH